MRKKAIDSVLQPDVEGIELIVVDDGSTDGTKELMEQYNDERIRYMRTPVNRGVANARNAGNRRLIPDEKLPMEKRVGKIYEQLLRVNHIGAPAICVKREALTGPGGVGVFDTVMPNLEDYDLVLRLTKKYKTAYVDEVLIDTYQM